MSDGRMRLAGLMCVRLELDNISNAKAHHNFHSIILHAQVVCINK